jgi:hypothetical protein
MIAELLKRLRRLAFFPLIKWPAPERLALISPEEVILILFFSPLWVFCFGIELILLENQS